MQQWIAPKGMLNDAVYEGECTGVPDGAGILLTPSFAYMGEWENGTQHGYGVYICLVSRCRCGELPVLCFKSGFARCRHLSLSVVRFHLLLHGPTKNRIWRWK